MLKKIGFLAVAGVVIYLIWWDINFDEYMQDLAEEKQYEITKSENPQERLANIIMNTIYIGFSRATEELADEGISTPEANFTIDVEYNVEVPNDFRLKIIDQKSNYHIVYNYQETCPVDQPTLKIIIKSAIKDLLIYYRNIPNSPGGLRIET